MEDPKGGPLSGMGSPAVSIKVMLEHEFCVFTDCCGPLSSEDKQTGSQGPRVRRWSEERRGRGGGQARRGQASAPKELRGFTVCVP